MALFCETPFCCLLLLFLQGCTGTPCAVFEFPTLNNSVLTAKENTTVELPFKVSSVNCSLPDDFKITIQEIKDNDRSEFGLYCSIRQVKGYCRRPLHENGCGCMPENDMYRMKKTVDRTDKRLWRWSADPKVVMDKELTFNIIYPSTIHNLTIQPTDSKNDSHVVQPESTVDVVCVWEDGNPPSTARLLDRHGEEMSRERVVYSGDQIRYRFPAVGCQDAGLIRCEAPGASHNKTATLLVRCPPEFETGDGTNKTADVGNPLHMDFRVRMHTADATDCQLRQFPPDSGSSGFGSRHSNNSNGTDWSFCNLNGTLPDLTLTVWLDNVTEKEFGRWRLELTNDVGTGHVDFYILNPEAKKTKSKSGKFKFREIVIVASAGTVVAIIVCVCIVVACKRKGSRERFSRDVLGRREEDAMFGLSTSEETRRRRHYREHDEDDDLDGQPSFTMRSRSDAAEELEGSTSRDQSDLTHTFQPFRPQSFQIFRMGSRLFERVSQRVSRLSFE